MSPTTRTIAKAMADYLDLKSATFNPGTARTYENALKRFAEALTTAGLPPTSTKAKELNEDHIKLVIDLARERGLAIATERLYLTAVVDFFKYLEAERVIDVNEARLRGNIRFRKKRQAKRLPHFPKDAIPVLIDYALSLNTIQTDDPDERLRNLRDRALIVTLADTGLRIHEACNLLRGDIDWRNGQAILIGKGNKEAVIRFSQRSLGALKDYLNERTRILDGNDGRGLQSLPVFARHDRGAGKRRVKPITPRTGQHVIEERCAACIPQEQAEQITPHTLRHYFVTHVLDVTGNLKIAQQLARHENISMTERYAHLVDHELDDLYRDIFDK
jgi:integrase/recombinase XerC